MSASRQSIVGDWVRQADAHAADRLGQV